MFQRESGLVTDRYKTGCGVADFFRPQQGMCKAAEYIKVWADTSVASASWTSRLEKRGIGLELAAVRRHFLWEFLQATRWVFVWNDTLRRL